MGIMDIKFFQKKDNVIFDSLTKTLSRHTFYEYMNFLIENKTPFSFFFFDFDDFKSINDILGHNVGDEALIITSNRICEVVHKYGGAVGRYGGDEFFAIIENKTNYEEIRDVAKEINQIIREKNNIKNIEQALPAGKFTITSGITKFPDDGSTLEELFDATDKALYAGKQKGKNCYIIYRKELHKDIFKVRQAKNLDTKNLIDNIFSTLTDKEKSLDDNLKNACSFIADYFDVSVFSKNYKNKFEILFSNGLMPKVKYIDENKYLNMEKNQIDQMIFMYINSIDKENKELIDLFEEQEVHASLLIPCATKSKLYGYIRIDSKYERIWAREEKIVFQVIANLYAVLLEYTNQEF